MSDGQQDAPLAEAGQAPTTAGGLLKQARLAKGLHIAALATSIKVAPRKLELLETDRFDELPGATFTRALAQTVCRTLKIDPAPVLALLPQPAEQGLSQMSLGLNAPFRDRPGRRVPSDLAFLKSPVLIGAAVLVLASLALYFMPAGWIADLSQVKSGTSEATVTTPLPTPNAGSAPSALPAATAASDAIQTSPAASAVPGGAASGVLQSTAATVPPAPLAASAPASAASPGPSGALLVRTTARSWVEVIDGRGHPLLSRLLEPGEAVGLDGPSPLRVRIGNAAATKVSFRGRPVEMMPTRDNVAKFELR